MKKAVMEAVDVADKERSMECLKNLSRLAARAVYNHDYRTIVVIDESISEIKKAIDNRLEALKEPADITCDVEKTRIYMLAYMRLLPVSFTLNAMKSFLASAMAEADYEIGSRINEFRKLTIDNETGSA